AALFALLSIAAVRGLGRRSWPATVVTLICGLSIVLFVLRDGPPPGSDLTWGWWVTLIGGWAIVAAGIATAVARLRGEPEQRWVASTMSWRRSVPAGLAIAGTVLLLVV